MNRLASEPSPYLHQHAENPVDWYPWGPEALEKARREDRPILLSIGYSACHWCHVMAHESFENPATAALMNKLFINVKVDREERPDVDQLYQGAVQLMGRGGGWPLTVFLTPDLRPFFAGTYFPPEPRHGLPAFSELLERVAEAWVNERAPLEQQANEFKAGLAEFASYGLDATAAAITENDLVSAARAMERRIDRRHGGFGSSGPKFPNPMNLAMMLRGYRRTHDRSLLDAVTLTLDSMANGGIFDQLGGGFHRYSVDERWLVPHFEKMLYDNAQLIHLYSEAFQLTRNARYRDVVERTVGWLAREMTHESGGFYAAQDADSEGEEGKYFVWRRSEIEALLSPSDAALVCAHFGIDAHGNFEHGTSILERVRDEATLAADLGVTEHEVRTRLAASLDSLLTARQKRVPPGTDDKILTGWNGLMIRGLCLASEVFERPEWATIARRAAEFVLLRLRAPDGALRRSFQPPEARLPAVLEDYGDLALGLVQLSQTTRDFSFLEAAERLADDAWHHFWDDEKRGWLAAHKAQRDLLVPTYALHDNAFPSGASTLTQAQLVLASLTGHTRHLERATTYLERMRREMVDNPMGYGHLLLAADALVDGTPEVTVVTKSNDALAPFERYFAQTYLPTVSRHLVASAPPFAPVVAQILDVRPARDTASAYLCRQYACQAPVSTVTELEALLRPHGAG